MSVFRVFTQAELDEALLTATTSDQVELVGDGDFDLRSTPAPRIDTWGSGTPRIYTRGSITPRIYTRGSSTPQIDTWDSSTPQIDTLGSSTPRITDHRP